MALTPTQRWQLEVKGYVVVPGIVSDTHRSELLGATLYGTHHADPAFEAYFEGERTVSIIEEMLGQPRAPATLESHKVKVDIPTAELLAMADGGLDGTSSDLVTSVPMDVGDTVRTQAI